MARTPNELLSRHFHRKTERRAVAASILLFTGLLVFSEFALPVNPSMLLAQLGDTTTHAEVEPNPVNSLYAQLEGRSEDLAEREAELIEREIAAGIAERQRQDAVMLYALFGILALLIINALFDILEMRELHELERQLKTQHTAPSA